MNAWNNKCFARFHILCSMILKLGLGSHFVGRTHALLIWRTGVRSCVLLSRSDFKRFVSSDAYSADYCGWMNTGSVHWWKKAVTVLARRTVRKVRAKLHMPVFKTVISSHDIRGRYPVVMKIVNHQLSGVSNTSLVALVGIEHCAC